MQIMKHFPMLHIICKTFPFFTLKVSLKVNVLFPIRGIYFAWQIFNNLNTLITIYVVKLNK